MSYALTASSLKQRSCILLPVVYVVFSSGIHAGISAVSSVKTATIREPVETTPCTELVITDDEFFVRVGNFFSQFF